MGKWIHRLIDGQCVHCGSVPLVMHHGRPTCSVARKQQRGIESARQKRRAAIRLQGLCPICLEPLTDQAAWDHDHLTGKFRAYLCLHCNVGLGHFRDNPVRLKRAIAYLVQESPPV